ncbi:MAG: PHP domain-containing protein [Mogibacterium sp.]|nr:PHP domain-containing protein [Mogibacterium sp.]
MNALEIRPAQIDLHIHTTISDGTDTPAELLGKVRAAGIRLFAITDHDAVRGCEEMIRLLAEQGEAETGEKALRFLTGVEFSCKDLKGSYHILGYGYDPDAEPVRRLAAEAHEVRLRKLQGRLDRLRSRRGIEFAPEEVAALQALSNPGKPHIANLLVRRGYAATREEAIAMIGDLPEMRNLSFRPEQAVEAILQSGGIPVLAHPSYGNGSQHIYGTALAERVGRLTEMGLRGLEAYYSEFTPDLIRENLALADRFGLYVTAGSDYHGTNKKIPLGKTHLAEVPELPAGLQRFLKDVTER